MTAKNEGLAHCKFVLVFAVFMDVLGIITVLIGVFVPLQVKGREFGDLLVYSGALLVLLSMAAWVLWYSGNIEGLALEKELGFKQTPVDRLAHSLSRRIRKNHHSHATPWPLSSQAVKSHLFYNQFQNDVFSNSRFCLVPLHLQTILTNSLKPMYQTP